ncbi:NAD(P)H-hydrate dehydratase [Patescibacteria group bacterium]
MEKISQVITKSLYQSPKSSHKGQNGKLTIIGGSKLFHGASLWALKTASRIVDMVFYSTVLENEQLTKKLKSDLFDFICIPRGKIEEYIEQSDAVLIGPGMVRGSKEYTGTGESGVETTKLTKSLTAKFPQKKWIIDAGALQAIKPKWLLKLKNVVITPHKKELEKLFNIKVDQEKPDLLKEQVLTLSQRFNATILLKGQTDLVCSPKRCVINTSGNEGMTKGGTGDVLAGLIAALSCKNDLFTATSAGVYINGRAGDELYKHKGPFYNASDLCEQIPKTMNHLFGY